MGIVYLGVTPAGRPVAVKVIRPRFAGDDAYRARFRREAAAARTVAGAFTAVVLDADPDAGEPYLVTAYLPGVSLREAVAIEALPPASVRTLAAGLIEALADIHRAGLAHRDVKPSNVMLTPSGPRVIDFGIARADDATAITRVGTVLGTPGFMAPEQVHGQLSGPAADVFALGAVVAFAATGREPFGTGDTDSTLRRVAAADADLTGIDDPVLLDLITACLTVDPAARPTATALLDRFGHAGDTAGWLPAAVAAAIDDRAAEARLLVSASTTRSAPSTASEVLPSDPTVDPSSSLPAAKPATVSRRAMVFGGGATLLAAAGVTAGIAALADDRVPGTARAGDASVPSTVPVREWRVRVSNGSVRLYVAGGRVIASSYNTGGIRALDPESGALGWQREADVVAGIDGNTAVLVNPRGWRVTAVDAATGTENWAYDPPYGEESQSAVLARDVVCFGTNGTVRAIGITDGQPRWATPRKVDQGFAAVGDVLVCVAVDSVFGLDIDTGQPRWTFDVPEFPAYPSAAPGLAYVCDTTTGGIRAVRGADGAVVWQQPGLGLSLRFWLAADRNAMYYSADGEVRGYAAATGAPLWTRPIGRRTGSTDFGNLVDKSTIALFGDTLYVVSNDGSGLHALDVTDGGVRWDSPDVPWGAEIAESGGSLFVATADGYVEAIRPPGGG
jgi:outer membrane protein assembly factor BamB